MTFDRISIKPTGRTRIKGADFEGKYKDLARQVTDSHYDLESAKRNLTFMNYSGTIFHLVGQLFANVFHNATTSTPEDVREVLSGYTWNLATHESCCELVHGCYKDWESDTNKWDTEPLHRWQAHEFTSVYCFPPVGQACDLAHVAHFLICVLMIQTEEGFPKAINHVGDMFECIYTMEKQRNERKKDLKLIK